MSSLEELSLITDDVFNLSAICPFIFDVLKDIEIWADLVRRRLKPEAASNYPSATTIAVGQDQALKASALAVMCGLQGECGLSAIHRPAVINKFGHARKLAHNHSRKVHSTLCTKLGV